MEPKESKYTILLSEIETEISNLIDEHNKLVADINSLTQSKNIVIEKLKHMEGQLAGVKQCMTLEG